MQFATAILAAIAVFGVSAAPAAGYNPPPGGNSGSSASCPSNGVQYCCEGGIVGLNCLVPILGNSCTQQSICCVNNGGTQTCTNGGINIPININL